MMIDVTIGASFTGSFADLYTQMNPLMSGSTVLWHTAKYVVFENDRHQRFTASGSDLKCVLGPDGMLALIGGTVDGLALREHGLDIVKFTSLQTTGAALWQAFVAERDGRDPAAVTHLLVRHCWTYVGNDHDDYFPQSTLPGFGALNPTGNDMIRLMGGDDTFFTGSARDTMFGGSGNDLLYGGSENDHLVGGSDADRAYGGGADDRLDGGLGADVLFGAVGGDMLNGGLGGDRLYGGLGDDLLSGGGGADVFLFGTGSGADVISDFQVSVDHLHIASGLAVTITAHRGDTLIQFGSDTVLLTGVHANQLSPGDFI